MKNQPTQIEGLRVLPLKKIENQKGAVLHVLKTSDPYFENFSEVYISVTNAGAIKGWKFHRQISQNFTVPVGSIRFVFYDGRKDSRTCGVVQIVDASYENYIRIVVPPKIWYSFAATSTIPAYIVNCATMEHDPLESMTLPLESDEIPFKWHSSI